jgi:hypothetical protein
VTLVQVFATASVVQDYSTYWVDFRSEPVQLEPQVPDATDHSSAQDRTLLPVGETEPAVEPEPALGSVTAEAAPRHRVYRGCGAAKSCFGLPGGCELLGSCAVVAAWRQQPGGGHTEVELFSPAGRGRYSALGMSADGRMGSDLVLTCSETAGRARAGLGWNLGRSHLPLEADTGMELLEVAGWRQCSAVQLWLRASWGTGAPSTAGLTGATL